jgi:anti-sigma factor RsiW
MPKCKKSEGQAIDYASKLLSTTEAGAFEQHLKNCSDCNQAVESFATILNLTDMAEKEVALPEVALRDIEMNVYKRLAATQEESLASRVRTYLAKLESLFQWHKTAAASTLVIAMITAAVLVGELFQPEVGLQLTESQSADARIEQYRQQDIQRNLEEALITHHLRNDAWDTESRLHRMKEHAHGTTWTKVADEHLQNLHSGTLNTP